MLTNVEKYEGCRTHSHLSFTGTFDGKESCKRKVRAQEQKEAIENGACFSAHVALVADLKRDRNFRVMVEAKVKHGKRLNEREFSFAVAAGLL